MHIIINDKYISLDDVLSVTEIQEGCYGRTKFFVILYKDKNSKEFSIQYNNEISGEVHLGNNGIIFKTEQPLAIIRSKIINILTNATESGQSNKEVQY